MGLNLLARVRVISRLLEQRDNGDGCGARGNKVPQPTGHRSAVPSQADQQRNAFLFENARDRRRMKQPISLRLMFSLRAVRLPRLPDLVILTIFAAATLLYSRGVFLGLANWAGSDWDQHLLYTWTTYRSLMEFSELPLWNPWYMGGNPQLGNPQVHFPTPMFLLDFGVGPLLGMKLNILAHHWLGLVGTYWLGRQLGLSAYAGLLAAGAFMLSTWYSLHLFVGHTQFLSMAFVPWVLAFVHRARTIPWRSVNISAAAALLALIVFEGGIYTSIFTAFLCGMLALCWCVQDRSWLPLVIVVLTMSLAGGLCAVKLLPVAKLLSENPRATPVGGPSWATAPSEADMGSLSRLEAGTLEAPPASRWPLIQQVMKVFLGRDQRGNEIYFTNQEYGWHEYGAYLGPIVIGLIALSPLVFRHQWPWLLSAAGCFLIALGNFAPFAPWTLLHYFPVMSNARVPTRFLMPCVLALSISAGFVLDCLRNRVRKSRSPLVLFWFKETRLEWATAFFLALCLADLALVGGRSFENTFDRAPQTAHEKNPNIITITGRPANMLGPMLQNYSTKDGYEEAHVPVRVSAVGEDSYRGEVYFVRDRASARGGPGETPLPVPIIESWSPNTVTVSVKTPLQGWLVVNRNWDDGWVSNRPYQAQSRNGLLSVALSSGEHLVHFSYKPASVMAGAAITLASVLAALVWCWSERRRLRPSSAR